MANIFKPKRSSTASSVPTTSDLSDGEIAVNSADKKIYLRDGASIIEVANSIDSANFLTSNAADTATQSTSGTPTLTIQNTGGAGSGSGTGAQIAKFVGDSDGILIQNIAGGDYGIYNTQQNNGFELYDGTGGVRILYNGNIGVEFDSGNTYGDFKGVPSVNGTSLARTTDNITGTSGGFTAGNASNLDSGTVPDARFPATLPAVSGANLTSVDATTLDGIDSANFLRSNVDDTATGQITFEDGDANPVVIKRSSQVGIEFNDTSVGSRYLGVNGGNLYWGNNLNHGTNNRVLTTADEGSGNGLDADTVDGIQAASFLRSDAADSFSGALTGSGTISVTGTKIECGRTSGSVAMTTNDGYGNANLCFNHTSGVPDVNGSSCRIETSVDNNTGFMLFEVGNSVTANNAVTLTGVLKLTTSAVEAQSGITFTGDGSGLTTLNASELDSGTIPDARFPATLPAASGANLTSLNASNLGSGTIPDARFPATLPAVSGANLTNLPAGSTIPVVDESSDTTCFPVFTTAATGNQAPKTGSNLTFNSSNGTLTATTFSGSGASLTSVDAATLDGIDSGSFIRSDANDNVSAHTEWQDNYEIRLGNSADFRMDFNGADTVFRSYAHANGDIIFQGETSGGTNQNIMLLKTDSTATYVNLRHNNITRMETTATGINITDRVGINSASPEASISLVGESGSASYLNFRENSTNNERVVIDQYGQLGLDVSTANIAARLHISTMADNGIIVEDMFGTTLFTVNADDRVGIGMTDPASMLGVKGDVTVGDGSDQSRILIKKADNNTSDHIQFYNGTTRVGEIGCHDTTWLRINQVTNKNIYTPRYIRADAGFFVDGTAKGINGSGNFIGGTIAGASDYGTLLRSNAADTASQSTQGTPTLTIENTGGAGSGTGTGALVAKFVGDSDGLEIRNISAGDYGIYNSAVATGIEFYDGLFGVRIIYNGTNRVEFGTTNNYGDFKGTPTVNGDDVWHAGNKPANYAKYVGTGTPNLNNASYAEVSWINTTPQFSNGTWSATSSHIVVPATGLYMIQVNMYVTSSNARMNVGLKFAINDVQQSEIAAHDYIRSATGHNESSINMSTTFSLSANDQISVYTQRLAASGTCSLQGTNSTISITQLA